jgi:signal transduction histidine kinase
MKRGSFRLWFVFSVVAAAAFAGLVWLSVASLRLERAERHAEAQEKLQEALRLALWRIDSRLAPELAREASRPYFHYQSFYAPSLAYTNRWSQYDAGDVRLPSPLAGSPPAWIRLHFQLAPDGTWSSPQVPIGEQQDVASQLGLTRRQQMANGDILTRIPSVTAPTELRKLAAAAEAAARREPLEVALLGTRQPQTQPASPQPVAQQTEQQQAAAQVLSMNELMQRNRTIQRQMKEANYESIQGNSQFGGNVRYNLNNSVLPADSPAGGRRVVNLRQGEMLPVWAQPEGRTPELLFLRTLTVGADKYIQGFWVDWNHLRDMLESEVRDLFPRARLKPRLTNDFDPALAATTVPALLEPGQSPAQVAGGWTPTRIGLAVTWTAFGISLLVVGLGLRSLVNLTERRLEFVSAVTHELRTPLTTFRMYTEMLTEGMVPDDRRDRYCRTLQRESERLSHLVQNVLDYSRLERQAWRPQRESVFVRDLVDRLQARSTDRSSEAEMELAIESDAPNTAVVRTDAAALEQIVYNLVDNACKYARGTDDRRVHLRVRVEGRDLVVEVADHGPGISRQAQGRLFEPFYRDGGEDVQREPGVGLGLALARRWTGALGGKLEVVGSNHTGACFRIRLAGAVVS